MPRCPNCFYSLVLFEHRRKYKCAKCGRIFPQKLIEDSEFVAWNKKRRREEEEKVEQELQEIIKKSNKKLTIKEIQERERVLQKKWKEKNKDYINAYKREYWAKHRDRLLAKRKENYQDQKAEVLKKKKVYRQDHPEISKLHTLRSAQKRLALEKFKSAPDEAQKNKILDFLLTF